MLNEKEKENLLIVFITLFSISFFIVNFILSI